jgi:hypothetical protein
MYEAYALWMIGRHETICPLLKGVGGTLPAHQSRGDNLQRLGHSEI